MVSGEHGDRAESAVSLAEFSSEDPAELARALGGRTSERPGFVEAAEHGEQVGSGEQRCGLRILGEDGVERPQCLVGRPRSKDESAGESGHP